MIVVSLLSFVGVLFLGFNESLLKRLLTVLVGFASGSLLGSALFHMVPQALDEKLPIDTVSQLLVFGILLFFIMEKFLYWRHCHEKTCNVHMFAYLNLFGDSIHNFVDGMTMAAGFIVDISLGIATTLAVMLHEIPQEIGDFGVLVYGGLTKKRALTYNFLSAIIAIVGALVTYFAYAASLFVPQSMVLLIPFAAGGFIYIAATDLMPELHKKSGSKDSAFQLAAIVLGLLLMWLLKYFE